MSSHDGFDDLEAELIALGDSLDVPMPLPGDVASAVRARLQADHPATNPPQTDHPATDSPQTDQPATNPPQADQPAPASPKGRPRKRPARRRARWKIVTAAILAVIAVTAATPQGRAAVVTILDYAGIELRFGDRTPAPAAPASLPGERAVAPEDLPALVKFPIKTPRSLGPPEHATVSDNGRVASMFWPDGVRLDQFDGAPSPYFFKQIGPPWPEDIQVADVTGWWVGGRHPLGYIKRDDGTEVPLRQAEPTLIWQVGSVGYRLEGAGTKERAAEIGSSLS